MSTIAPLLLMVGPRMTYRNPQADQITPDVTQPGATDEKPEIHFWRSNVDFGYFPHLCCKEWDHLNNQNRNNFNHQNWYHLDYSPWNHFKQSRRYHFHDSHGRNLYYTHRIKCQLIPILVSRTSFDRLSTLVRQLT